MGLHPPDGGLHLIYARTDRKLNYIYASDGLFVIYVMNGENDTMYYVHKDYLGSYDVITDERGIVLERLSFDPWGRRRNATDWTFNHMPASYLFDRGYTGHEHLDVFSLINMNGRVYDPWLGRFLSPDPVVQAPGYSQSYNRYSYCFNNPLKYSDPSGFTATEFKHLDLDNHYGSDSSEPGYIPYQYNWITGKYYDSNGNEVSFDVVFVNYIQPNSVGSEINLSDGNNNNGINNTATGNFPGSISFGLNAYGQWQIIAVTNKDGKQIFKPYLDDQNIQVSTIFLDYKNGEEEDLSFIAAEAVTVALSLSDHAIEQFIKANATGRTYYTTLSGSTKFISKTKLLEFCKVAARYVFVASALVNSYGVLSGNENPFKAGLNIAVDYLPFVIGTGPGLVIGVIYYGIEYTIGWDGVMTPAENHPYIYYGPCGIPLPK